MFYSNKTLDRKIEARLSHYIDDLYWRLDRLYLRLSVALVLGAVALIVALVAPWWGTTDGATPWRERTAHLEGLLQDHARRLGEVVAAVEERPGDAGGVDPAELARIADLLRTMTQEIQGDTESQDTVYRQ